MSYTIWSRGLLLGQTDLGFTYQDDDRRGGWFYPNVLGERLLPVATGVAPAVRAAEAAGLSYVSDPRIIAAIRDERSLALELRGPDGEAIDTHEVSIIDTEYLASIADETWDDAEQDEWLDDLDADRRAELEAIVEHELTLFEESIADPEPEPWMPEPALPAYQIQVRLVDQFAIP